jgi:Protein of unknown function (DUF3060)
MEPQDNPEDRIRELERSLTDQASSSELGTAQSGAYGGSPTPPPTYGAPFPLPPPPTYGAPFPPPPIYGAPFRGTPAKRGLGAWSVLLALFVVGLVVAAGIAAFGAHLFSGRGSSIASPTNRPSISRAPRTNTAASPPTTSASATPAPSAAAPTSTAPAGARVTISGIGKNKAVACNNNAVNVSGVSNTIVITGHCASLTVSGFKNMITVDTADTIDASGFNNQITYHSGAPTVSNSGESNVVQQG